MKKGFLLSTCVLLFFSSYAQQKVVKKINKEVSRQEIESHMRYYASDEMRGRNTGTIENRIAARYIAERFRSYGVLPIEGNAGYFQEVGLTRQKVPTSTLLKVGDSTYSLWKDIIMRQAVNLDVSSDGYVFISYGTAEDLDGKDFQGKLAVGINAMPKEGTKLPTAEKLAILKDKGAKGLLDLYRPTRYNWPPLVNYLSNDSYQLNNQSEGSAIDFPVGWIVDPDNERLKFFTASDSLPVSFKVEGAGQDNLTVPNVVGYIPGTDPQLKDEFILISAHLDHVGVKNATAGEDSIYNGARDNGIGITNMLATAEYFGKNPTKRSLLFLACNAEEVGLLGSRWYAEHPLVPLKKTVYNINTDTGGYNDITKITVIGLNKTNTTEKLVGAGQAFGLDVIDDPVPEENLYQRSDNYSFAAKGVPSISFGPGMTAMDEAITKYYHQPGDEPATIDFDYLTTYSKAYIYAVYLLSEMDELKWAEGDPYEKIGKELYK